MNKATPGVRILLGGNTIHNMKRYIVFVSHWRKKQLFYSGDSHQRTQENEQLQTNTRLNLPAMGMLVNNFPIPQELTTTAQALWERS